MSLRFNTVCNSCLRLEHYLGTWCCASIILENKNGVHSLNMQSEDVWNWREKTAANVAFRHLAWETGWDQRDWRRIRNSQNKAFNQLSTHSSCPSQLTLCQTNVFITFPPQPVLGRPYAVTVILTRFHFIWHTQKKVGVEWREWGTRQNERLNNKVLIVQLWRPLKYVLFLGFGTRGFQAVNFLPNSCIIICQWMCLGN